ncbi:MAG: hypothetical protein AAB618_03000 [Patescibacteria group bacterium]
MNILFWGLTIGTAGKVLLGIGVIIAHSSLVKERKIDLVVLRGYRIEHTITVIGLLLIVLGYFMEVYFYGFTPFLTCSGAECSAAIINAFPE